MFSVVYFAGIRPTGPQLHLGHYESVIKPILSLQHNTDDCQVYLMIADLHALSGKNENISFASHNIAKEILACGINPQKVNVFLQSRVPYHSQLAVLLQSIVQENRINHIPTVKQAKKEGDVSMGLINYPILQTADILLHSTDTVIIGKDQVPHIDFCNDIVSKFNYTFETDFLKKVSIMSGDKVLPGLDMRKMSKSYNNCVFLLDSPEHTQRKITSAFTTPSKIRISDPGIPEGCAVCQYLKLYSPQCEIQIGEDERGERGCRQNKKELSECINNFLRPIREKAQTINDEHLNMLSEGNEKAFCSAKLNYEKIRDLMGL